MTELTGRDPSALGAAHSTGGGSTTSLGDILERVLDKGLVIAGDIQVNLLDIELLTIKLRLVVASLDTAKQVGIDWWENDPWLTGNHDKRPQLAEENKRLRERIAELEGESSRSVDGAVEDPEDDGDD